MNYTRMKTEKALAEDKSLTNILMQIALTLADVVDELTEMNTMYEHEHPYYYRESEDDRA